MAAAAKVVTDWFTAKGYPAYLPDFLAAGMDKPDVEAAANAKGLKDAARAAFIDSELNERLMTLLDRQREVRAKEKERLKAEKKAEEERRAAAAAAAAKKRGRTEADLFTSNKAVKTNSGGAAAVVSLAERPPANRTLCLFDRLSDSLLVTIFKYLELLELATGTEVDTPVSCVSRRFYAQAFSPTLWGSQGVAVVQSYATETITFALARRLLLPATAADSKVGPVSALKFAALKVGAGVCSPVLTVQADDLTDELPVSVAAAAAGGGMDRDDDDDNESDKQFAELKKKTDDKVAAIWNNIYSLLPAVTELDRSASGAALTVPELTAIARHCGKLQRLRISGTDAMPAAGESGGDAKSSSSAAAAGAAPNTRLFELCRRVSVALPALKSLSITPYEMEGATDESFEPNDIPAHAALPLPAALERFELEGDDSDQSDQWLLYGRIDWKSSLGGLKHLKSIVRPAFNPDENENTPACVTCSSGENEAALLLCDSCPATFHITCLRPALNAVPDGGWMCQLCTFTQRFAPPKPAKS